MNSYWRQLTHALRSWNQMIVTMATVLCWQSDAQPLWPERRRHDPRNGHRSTGAVIPGASIHVVNQATGIAVDTKSNNVGFYQVPATLHGHLRGNDHCAGHEDV